MDFEFYRNFVTVAETGSLTAAAKKLAIAQPALSAQLRTMEKYYGVRLIKTGRGRRQLVLTEAGRDFLRKAEQLCLTEENIVLDMQGYSRQAAGTLRFSVSYVAVQSFMDTFLLPFSRRWPQIDFQLREEGVSSQMESLKNGLSDFAYANAPLADSDEFVSRRIRKERFVAAGRPELLKRLSGGSGSLELAVLEGTGICCNFGCYGILRKRLGELGISPPVRFISTSGSAAVSFAESGGGVAIVSEDSVTKPGSGLMVLPLTGEPLSFEQKLYWLKKLSPSPAARTFLSFCDGILGKE